MPDNNGRSRQKVNVQHVRNTYKLAVFKSVDGATLGSVSGREHAGMYSIHLKVPAETKALLPFRPSL